MRSPFEKGALGRIVALVLVGVLGVWLVYDLVDASRGGSAAGRDVPETR